MPSTMTTPDTTAIRAQFPAITRHSDIAFLENAGGSQMPGCVAKAMHAYMTDTFVQVGAPYAISQKSTSTVRDAHAFVNLLMNGGGQTDGPGAVVLGSSATTLFQMIANAVALTLQPGDEIIYTDLGHESNVGCWERLAERGATVKNWSVDPETGSVSLDDLDGLLSERTRIVAYPHVSNITGEILEVRAINDLVHRYGARVVLDSVAYAPHRAIDVQAWDADFCGYSVYKVYGPHMAALYGKREAFAELPGPNHSFVPDDELPRKFQPGGASHEGCAGILALPTYLRTLIGAAADAPVDRALIEQAFTLMTEIELPLQARLIEYLAGRDDVRIIGPAHGDASRVATISFVHKSSSSQEIATAVCDQGFAIRYGNMYSKRLVERLGLDAVDGVVRISMVHYNTMDEIEGVIRVLDRVL